MSITERRDRRSYHRCKWAQLGQGGEKRHLSPLEWCISVSEDKAIPGVSRRTADANHRLPTPDAS